ncbi:tripartite tricarboxylate transporter TctB family protein [Billgrantia pellis]|uniref:Tripartite tricarboxylate transporter TctB family protein n=1 Tax=Billgrantia pellis TaxID=2606936 RepID=A0A7V7FZJ8_9GAMM|nr:tripartite tricarboxylate transporter TctB family protein [Halomonas pellis]KAA0011979.1 tripartite tricarboxylate transporter TctB family protein [Halomonas pellis]
MQVRIYLFALAIILLALVSLVPTLQFPSSAQVSTFIGPRVWPLSLIVMLFLLGCALLAMTWRDSRRSAHDKSDSGQEGGSTASAQKRSFASTRHWWLMAATVGYTVLMQAVGFLAASVMFTLLCTLLLGARSWLAIAITVTVAVALMQGVFVILLGIPLP